MRNAIRFTIFALPYFLMLFLCTPTHPAENINIELGFDGYYKKNSCLPVTIDLSHFPMPLPDKVSVIVQGMDWRSNELKVLRIYSAGLLPQEVREGRLSLPIRITNMATQVTVAMTSLSHEVYSKKIDLNPVGPNDIICLILTSDSSHFNPLPGLKLPKRGEVKTAFPAPGYLPSRWIEYDGIDVIVLDDIDLELFSEKQRAALKQWLVSGGRLIITAQGAERNANNTTFKQIFKGMIGNRIEMINADLLGRYSGYRDDLIEKVNIIQITVPKSDEIFSKGGYPMLIRQERGLGQVIVCAFDTRNVFLQDPTKLDGFYRSIWTRLLIPDSMISNKAWSTRFLVPKEGKTSFLYGYVGFFLLLYVIILGPINFVVLKKLDRKEYILFTIPVVVVIFSAFAYVIGWSLRTNRVILNSFTVTFATPGENNLTSKTYLGILSPDRSPYRFWNENVSAFPEESIENDWDEISKIGRMPIEIQINDKFQIENMEIGMWSMRFFKIQHIMEAKDGLQGNALFKDDSLIGSVTNNLPFTLTNCHLVMKWNHTPLGDIAPGTSRDFNLPLVPRIREGNTGGGYWFAHEYWKSNPFGEKELEFSNAVCHQYQPVFEKPVLIGWYEPSDIKININREKVDYHSKQLYVCSIPLYIDSDQISVPQGLSVSTRVGTELTEEFEDTFVDIGASRNFSFRIGSELTTQFDMPFSSYDIESDELTVYIKLRKAYPDEPVRPVRLSIYDWGKDSWTILAEHVTDGVAQKVEEPDRFIRFPEGMVKIKAELQERKSKGFEWLPVDFIDISYKGHKVKVNNDSHREPDN